MGFDENEQPALRRQIRRQEVVLVPPQYIKPYVQRGKNDKIDAEAICEAMSRPKGGEDSGRSPPRPSCRSNG